ncbi:hypothetical protein GCM10007989_31420 [Devosia pacifica]|uniref:Enamine deaminase RidA (YjgF/YER057c/UK114 family) n=1 Tax=Devosia pacifica TaxID=1335967 RepID=A0A918VXY5_9HYPH|nr:RidA family protein [Devosia pacifica]GHA33018.1 hypothetical protein GCM10007989_31420 [Devosia pacifica]
MSTKRWTISSGSKFEKLAGYSRAVVDGEWVFISGTAGHDPADGSISEDPEQQARQSLRTITKVLEQADASLADIVKLNVYVASRDDVMTISKVLGEHFSDPRPTNTTIICGFPVEEIKVEIEVTALKRRA